MGVPGVESVHKIRSRAGTQGGHADLHVQLRPDLRLDEAHAIGHLVADGAPAGAWAQDVLVHVEPPVGHETGRPADEELGGPRPDRFVTNEQAGTGRPVRHKKSADPAAATGRKLRGCFYGLDFV